MKYQLLFVALRFQMWSYPKWMTEMLYFLRLLHCQALQLIQVSRTSKLKIALKLH